MVFALTTAGCAGPVSRLPVPERAAVLNEQVVQQKQAIEHQRAMLQRLQTIAWPLLLANADLCGKTVRRSLGLTLADATSTARDVKGLRRDDAIRAGVSGVYVAAVAEGSPAARAGLKQGDALEGTSVAAVGKVLQQAFKAGGAVTLKRLSGEALSITPATICAQPLRLTLSPSINAYTNGRSLVFHAGLMNAVSDDAQIRFVVAHELAHALLRHPRKGAVNSVISGGWLLAPVASVGGWVVDNVRDLIGQSGPVSWQTAGGKLATWPYGRAFEREADQLALYLLARSDAPLEGVEGIFSSFSKAGPLSTWLGISHPITPERIVAARQVRDEINAKRARGEALLPDGWPASSDRHPGESRDLKP